MLSNQLLILGNGFDLHCGLPSSYKSFFEFSILDTHGEHFGLKQLKAGVSGFWENLLLEYKQLDYLSFEFSMIMQGRKYLFEEKKDVKSE